MKMGRALCDEKGSISNIVGLLTPKVASFNFDFVKCFYIMPIMVPGQS